MKKRVFVTAMAAVLSLSMASAALAGEAEVMPDETVQYESPEIGGGRS